MSSDKVISQSRSSLGRRWSLLSSLGRRQTSKRQSSPQRIGDAPSASIEIPTALWLSHVLPFLDRFSQDALVQVHKEIWLARKQNEQHICWPTPGRISKFSRPVKSVAFVGPHGNELWVAYCKSHIKQYDKLKGPAKSKHLSHSRGAIAAVQCSPVDSSVVATAGERDGSLKLWRYNTDHDEWHCFRVLEVYQHSLRHMIWSPQGDRIATWGQEGLLQVSRVKDGALHGMHWKTRLEVAGCHRTVAFTPNGKSILYAHNNDTVNQWDFEGNRTHINVLHPELQDRYGSHRGAFVTGLSFTPDGKFLVVGCHVALVKIWTVGENNISMEAAQDNQIARPEYIYNRQLHLGGGWSAVTRLSFFSNNDSTYMACTNDGSQIRIVHLDSNQVVADWKGHKGRIESLCFTPDGKTLASGGCDRTIRLWDLRTLPVPSKDGAQPSC